MGRALVLEGDRVAAIDSPTDIMRAVASADAWTACGPVSGGPPGRSRLFAGPGSG